MLFTSLSILAATIGTLLMALYAKMPFAQACGMGLNSFFFVSFILPQVIAGGDCVQGYQAGLVIVLISGIIFMILSLTGARQYIAKAMPECLKKGNPGRHRPVHYLYRVPKCRHHSGKPVHVDAVRGHSRCDQRRGRYYDGTSGIAGAARLPDHCHLR